MPKQIYEVEYNGQVYEVEADSPEQAASAFAPQPTAEEPEQKQGQMYRGQRLALEGIWDAAAMAATSLVAQPTSGVVGLARLAAGKAVGEKDALDAAAEWQQKTAELLTDDPDGEAFQMFSKAVGPTVEALSRKVDDAIYSASGGSPELGAAAKTVLYGVPSVLGFRGMKIPKRFEVWNSNRKLGNRLAEEARAEGLELFDDTLPYSVRSHAERVVGGTQKGQGFDEVIDAVRSARNISKQEVDTAFDAARASTAVVELKPIKDAVAAARAKVFQEGGDPRWTVYNSRMKELEKLDEWYTGVKKDGAGFGKDGRTHIDLNELEIMRRRLNGSIKTVKPGSPEGRALIQVRNALDDGLDDLLQKGAISGDPDAVTLWQTARDLNRGHAERFNADKFVSKLLLKNMTPEDAYKLVIGMNSMNAKSQSVATVRRLKEILGPNHAALVHMRKAVLRDVLSPMFRDKTSFRAAISNIDKLLQNNYSLIQELDIPVSELRKMRRLAHAAEQAAATNPAKFDGAFATSVISSVAAGHSIARHGAFVRTVKRILDTRFGVGMLTKNDIKNLLIEGELGHVPIVEYSKPELSTWLAMTTGALAAQNSSKEEE